MLNCRPSKRLTIWILVSVLVLLFVSQRSFIAKKAFELSRHPIMATSVGLTFEYAAQFLAVKRIYLELNIIGFYHPSPAWKTHILIIPRKAIKDVFVLLEYNKHNYFTDILKTARSLLKSEFTDDAYTLIVNGGSRQDVP